MLLDSLEALYAWQLQDLYNAENQFVKALPGLAAAVGLADLRKMIHAQLRDTREQLKRLAEVIHQLEEAGLPAACTVMASMLQEAERIRETAGLPAVKDAAVIAAIQKINHHAIASYGTVICWAQTLGQYQAVDLLGQSLEEEKAADALLSDIARGEVNDAAEQEGTADNRRNR